MKKIYLLATALAALASCTSDEFTGDQTLVKNETEAIQFESSTPKMTRAAGAAAAEKLDYKFKVYGVKKVGETYSNVFASEAYNSNGDYNFNPKAYWVWYNANTAGKTTSNTSDWDYVGGTGTHGTTSHEADLSYEQTIKYWDYSANQYEFVAYSATVGSPQILNYQKDGFTVVATPAQLAGLYIADKLTISDKNITPSKPASGSATVNKIGDVVRFTFRSAATKVRLGIYETIPGYVVQNVKFRPNSTSDPEFDATTANAKLSGSFNGTSSSSTGTYDITYNIDTGIAEFDNKAASANNYFDFGTFASATPTPLGETSTTPMWASGSTEYQSVLPNTDNVGNMILKVDYDLYNSTSGETIHVKGAKAVIPSIYMKWYPNYAYTYLFKISDNTNGTTGIENTSPEGIFPITFDALTIATNDGYEVGTITTVSTPAITTYQDGSVSAAGITYANANGPIYITVSDNGTLASLTAENTKLYTVDAGTTEADLILKAKTPTPVTTGDDVLTILSANKTEQGIAFESGKAAKFTPTASATYAVEYKVSDAVATTYKAATGTYVSGTKYYTDVTGATEVDTSSFTSSTDVSSYFVVDVTGSPAVYQYKIIEVGANS